MMKTGPLLLAAFCLALLLILRLSLKVDNLEGRIEVLQDRAYTPFAGYSVPTFTTTTLAGNTVTLGEAPAGTRQLLFIFNTSCPYCLASLPAWEEIRASADSSADLVEIYGVSLDSTHLTRQYAAEHALGLDLIEFPQRKLMHLYRAGTVPRIMLLNEEGRILYSRTGALVDRNAIDSVLHAIAEPMK
jgi:peroxiredoxin